MTTKYGTDAEDFLEGAEGNMSEVHKYPGIDRHKQLASAQVFALMSIAESLLTLTKHLTEKEEGAR